MPRLISLLCQAERYENPNEPTYRLYKGTDIHINISDAVVVGMIHSQPNDQGSIVEHHLRYLCPECEVVELAHLSDEHYTTLAGSGVPEQTIQVSGDTLQDPECLVRGPMGETDLTNLKIDLSKFPEFHRSQEPGQA